MRCRTIQAFCQSTDAGTQFLLRYRNGSETEAERLFIHLTAMGNSGYADHPPYVVNDVYDAPVPDRTRHRSL
jgi:hypothetical protein